MTEAPEPFIIGVDGGGTKTHAWLACVDRDATGQLPFTVLGKGRAGPANPASLGVERCIETVAEAVRVAFTDAGIARCEVAALSAGLAGAGQAVIAEQVCGSLRASHIAERITVADDVSPAWRAARETLQAQGVEPAYPAIVLASGTGAIAWGIDARGGTARAGGLGPQHGDPGSGYAIGQAALDAGLDLPEIVTLRRASLDAGAPSKVTDIAGLARAVIEQCDKMPAARAIVERIADDLCAFICDVAGQLGGEPGAGLSLVMTGSVLCQASDVSETVISKLISRGYKPTTTTRIADPVLGSLLSAWDMLRGRG